MAGWIDLYSFLYAELGTLYQYGSRQSGISKIKILPIVILHISRDCLLWIFVTQLALSAVQQLEAC